MRKIEDGVPIEAFGPLHSQQLRDRRDDIDRAHLAISELDVFLTGHFHEERNIQDVRRVFVVFEMTKGAAWPEAHPMIGCDHENGPVVEACFLELVDQFAEESVSQRYLHEMALVTMMDISVLVRPDVLDQPGPWRAVAAVPPAGRRVLPCAGRQQCVQHMECSGFIGRDALDVVQRRVHAGLPRALVQIGQLVSPGRPVPCWGTSRPSTSVNSNGG